LENSDKKATRIWKTRRVVGDILIALTVIFTLYLCVIMSHRINTVVLKDSYVEIFLYERIVCVFFLLFALDVRFGFFTRMKTVPLKMLGWMLRILVVFVVCVILFFSGRIIAGGFLHTAGEAKTALVLGLALENGKPTNDLLSRLDTAQQYLESHPDAMLILTGGNPDASGKTEAAVMRETLLERGVPEEKLLLEDQAETTKENFLDVKRMIDPNEPVVLITSDYHMDRAVRTAKAAGFTDAMRMPAPSSALSFGANVLWEVILELNELTLKQ
jgi:uncharacterized SAM-binding protein YcdF (DUF218 family)